VHVVWSKRDDLQLLYGNVLGVWQPWAVQTVTGAGIDSGHHMAEDAPNELAKELEAFFINHSIVQPES
jgi:haloacetate dehalogenase